MFLESKGEAAWQWTDLSGEYAATHGVSTTLTVRLKKYVESCQNLLKFLVSFSCLSLQALLPRSTKRRTRSWFITVLCRHIDGPLWTWANYPALGNRCRSGGDTKKTWRQCEMWDLVEVSVPFVTAFVYRFYSLLKCAEVLNSALPPELLRILHLFRQSGMGFCCHRFCCFSTIFNLNNAAFVWNLNTASLPHCRDLFMAFGQCTCWDSWTRHILFICIYIYVCTFLWARWGFLF